MMSVPSIRIEPPSGRRGPIGAFRKTDLPVPEGPSNTLTSPAGISSVTSSQILEDPQDFVNPLTSMAMPIKDPSDAASPPPALLCGLSHCSARRGRDIRVAEITIRYCLGALNLIKRKAT